MMELLRNNIPRANVFVDETQLEVDQECTSNDLIRRAGRNPSTYSLIKEDSSGTTTMLPAGKRIRLRNGERFETSLNGRGG